MFVLDFAVHIGSVTRTHVIHFSLPLQLFGDAMNTCGTIETSSGPSSIHCSKATAALLKSAGKESWAEPRLEKV